MFDAQQVIGREADDVLSWWELYSTDKASRPRQFRRWAYRNLVNSEKVMRNLEPEQREVCRRFGVIYEPLDFNLKLGVSDNFFSGASPLNGLRVKQEFGTCGWYLWAGEEFSEDADFFKPLHVYHLLERSPEVLKYLTLPEGWRFLVAGEYEDVWFDRKLLEG